MDFKKIIEDSIKESFEKSGKIPKQKPEIQKVKKESFMPSSAKKGKEVINEALISTKQEVHLTTERLSQETKKNHEELYEKYIDAFNKASSALDTANTQEANSNNSDYRDLKNNETYNLNAIKLHELYFNNISDLASEVSVDSLPYIKLSRNFGTFENWQFDFMAACRSTRNGWGVLVYEPHKNVYMNVAVDLHNKNIPLGAVPILVIDMWEHAYYDDYQNNKDDYIVSMMREINWDVVEARMVVAEKSELSVIYSVKTSYNTEPGKMIKNASSELEYDDEQNIE